MIIYNIVELKTHHESHQIVTLLDMRQEYAFALAKLELGLTFHIPEDVFAFYIQGNYIKKALEFGKLFEFNLSRLFIQLTRTCISFPRFVFFKN